MKSFRIALFLLPVLLSGCRFYETATAPADYYYLNPNKELSGVGRVALVELSNESSYPDIRGDVTEMLFRSLQKKQLFSLSIVHRNNPAWRSLQLDWNQGSQIRGSALGTAPEYTLEQLSVIRKTLNCNAVLTGTITQYQPYPHIVLGLRLKLVDLRDGQLLWGLEEVWDAADKTTENRIKKYFRSQMQSGFSSLGEKLVAVSSLKFIRFVAYEVSQTLPTRQPKPKNSLM